MHDEQEEEEERKKMNKIEIFTRGFLELDKKVSRTNRVDLALE